MIRIRSRVIEFDLNFDDQSSLFLSIYQSVIRQNRWVCYFGRATGFGRENCCESEGAELRRTCFTSNLSNQQRSIASAYPSWSPAGAKGHPCLVPLH